MADNSALTGKGKAVVRWLWGSFKRLIGFPLLAIALMLWAVWHIATGNAPDFPRMIVDWVES